MILAPPLRGMLLAAGALSLLTACSRMTPENLEKIHNGMSPPEVAEILGQPTTAETSEPLGVVVLTVYHYQARSSEVRIRFVNGKVISTDGEFK
jgi:hypothetical protein